MNRKFFHPIQFCFCALSLLLVVSCNPAKKYERAERELIANYLNNHPTDTFDLKPSGLYYRDVVVGTGSVPVAHDTVFVIYTGKFLNGTQFDSNVGKTAFDFPVSEGVPIAGFDEGITYMRQGGKAQFLVPSSLGFGSSGYYAIGSYTPLLYDVELVLVKAGPGEK